MHLHKLRHEYVKRIQNCNALYVSSKNDRPLYETHALVVNMCALPAKHFCEKYSYIMITIEIYLQL